MTKKRKTYELPAAIAKRGWRYHHLGIPTTTPRPHEVHLKHLGIHVTGFETSPYGIEWMRFDPKCGISEIIRTVPHIAFEVDDLEEALKGQTLLREITSPSRGLRVAMIIDNGAPIEVMEFARSRKRKRKPF
jgi:hypothetical protein